MEPRSESLVENGWMMGLHTNQPPRRRAWEDAEGGRDEGRPPTKTQQGFDGQWISALCA